MSEIFDPEILREIDSMSHSQAIQVANNIIDCSRMKEPKKDKLKRSIFKSNDSKKISLIMWNAFLVGDGLGSLDSNWNKPLLKK